jgi:hypothetical protein
MSKHPRFSLALQAQQRSGLLAPVLRAHMNCLHIDAVQLAALLHCSVHDLPRLWLCQMPDANQFEADIQRIAASTGVDAEALAQIIQQGSSCAAHRLVH